MYENKRIRRRLLILRLIVRCALWSKITVIECSVRIARILGKRKKSFSDAEVVKDLFKLLR